MKFIYTVVYAEHAEADTAIICLGGLLCVYRICYVYYIIIIYICTKFSGVWYVVLVNLIWDWNGSTERHVLGAFRDCMIFIVVNFKMVIFLISVCRYGSNLFSCRFKASLNCWFCIKAHIINLSVMGDLCIVCVLCGCWMVYVKITLAERKMKFYWVYEDA